MMHLERHALRVRRSTRKRFMMKKLTLIVMAMCVVGALVAGCSGDAAAGGTTGETGGTEKKTEEGK